MLDLSPQYTNDVISLLANNLPLNTHVYAFGSRARGDAKKFSDLDLLIKSPAALEIGDLAKLDDIFSESDLPFHTDIVDYHTISKEFYNAIHNDLILLKKI